MFTNKKISTQFLFIPLGSFDLEQLQCIRAAKLDYTTFTLLTPLFLLQFQMRFEITNGRKNYFCPAKQCVYSKSLTNISRHISRHHKNEPEYCTWMSVIHERQIDSKIGIKECSLCDQHVAGTFFIVTVPLDFV